jgi:hypothetical protein
MKKKCTKKKTKAKKKHVSKAIKEKEKKLNFQPAQ